MKKLLAFITSKTFFANLALAAIFFIVVFWLIGKGLNLLTHQSERIEVPDLSNLHIEEAHRLLEQLNLTYEVIDSAEFDATKPFGGVIDQFPKPGAEVKSDRVILLTINPFVTRKIEVPEIIEKTLRRAMYDIESRGFLVGTLTYIPDIGKDVVLGIQVAGRDVQPGEKFEKGTVLNLTIGAGLSTEPVPVPYLLSLSLAEAQSKAKSYSFNIGVIIYDEGMVDTLAAKVYRQNPHPSQQPSVRMGTPIDLWLSTDSTKIPSDSLYLYYERSENEPLEVEEVENERY